MHLQPVLAQVSGRAAGAHRGGVCAPRTGVRLGLELGLGSRPPASPPTQRGPCTFFDQVSRTCCPVPAGT